MGDVLVRLTSTPWPENVATVPGALTKPVAAKACYNRRLRIQADKGYADQVGPPGRQRPHAHLVQVRREAESNRQDSLTPRVTRIDHHKGEGNAMTDLPCKDLKGGWM